MFRGLTALFTVFFLLFTIVTYYETRYYDSVMGYGNAQVAGKNETADGSDVWDYDNEVSYTFGYGVEGSTFSEEVTEISIDWTGESDSSVTVKVTNTGDRAAKHVVQLYASVPYTDYDRESGLEKSAIQLIGYGKTGEALEDGISDTVLLEPGESEGIVITFDVTDFSSYDSNYSHDGVEGAYILEAGTYYFATGNGAHEAVQAVIKAQDETKLEDVEVTGTVFLEELEETVAFTVGLDGETLIQNQLEDMDFTYEEYGDAFTSQGAQYLTRADWSTTFPEAVTDVTANDYMLIPLNCETYDAEEANAAYDGVVYTEDDFGTDGVVSEVTVIDLLGITDYDDPLFEEVLSAIPLEDYITFICGSNAAVPEILLEKGNGADSPSGMIVGYGMYNDAREPYAVEAGEGSLRGTAPSTFAAEPVLAATFSHKLARAEGNMVGNDGLWIGTYWWCVPGLNLHRTPYNARNNEYYSEDSVLTGSTALPRGILPDQLRHGSAGAGRSHLLRVELQHGVCQHHLWCEEQHFPDRDGHCHSGDRCGHGAGQLRGFLKREHIYNLLSYALVILLTLSILLLHADRVDAIGNCIVAPWDAGHGGEDSCYLSFVSMGVWGVALIGNLFLCFRGYCPGKKPIVVVTDEPETELS